MSVKSDMVRDVANNFSNMASNAMGAVSSYYGYKANNAQREEQEEAKRKAEEEEKAQEDRLFNMNKYKLGVAYKTAAADYLAKLPESIDVNSYSGKMETFTTEWAQEQIDSGAYDENVCTWLMDEFVPSQKVVNEQAVKGAKNFAMNNWFASEATNNANRLAANPELGVEEAYGQYKTYYDQYTLGNVPTAYGILTPDEFKEIIRPVKAYQSFKKAAEDPETGYAVNYGFDKDEAIEKAMEEAGYVPDNENDNTDLRTQCEALLDNIDAENKAMAVTAQSQITSDVMNALNNGETMTASDVIEAAKQSGAYGKDGQVNRYWLEFLGPYIATVAKENAIAKALEESDGLTGDEVVEAIQEAKDNTAQKAAEEPRQTKGATKDSPPSNRGNYVFDETTMEETYTWEDSDELKFGMSLMEEAQTTMYVPDSEGNLVADWNGYVSEKTYKLDGYEDIKCSYSTIVDALCEKRGITTDEGKYFMAQQVQALADAGMFVDMDENMAYNILLQAQSDPDTTPREYDALVLQMVLSGAISREALDDYGLSSSDADGYFANNTTYNEALGILNDAVYEAFFSKDTRFLGIKTGTKTKKEDDLSTPEKIELGALRVKTKDALQKAMMADPTSFENDFSASVQKVLDSLMDQHIADTVQLALTSGKDRIWNTMDWRNRQTMGEYGLKTVFQPSNWATWFSEQSPANYNYSAAFESQTAKDLIHDFASGDKDLIGFYDADAANAFNNNFKATNLSSDTGNDKIKWSDVKKILDQTAKDLGLGDSYSSCSQAAQDRLAFTYFICKTRQDLLRYTCNNFGYDKSEVTVVAVADVGFAAITNDGKVFMPAELPDGSGRNWYIGRASGNARNMTAQTQGTTVLALSDLVPKGMNLQMFSDELFMYTKDGSSVINEPARTDKSNELSQIYKNLGY